MDQTRKVQEERKKGPNLLLTATDYKNEGNKLLFFDRYDEAIHYYSQAISKDPKMAILFSNRALCYLKLQQWLPAIQDCRRAIEANPSLIKPHFYLGQALDELGSYDDALKHLQRAHELTKEQRMNFGDDILCQIRLVKRHRLNKIEDDTKESENELRKYLVELIQKDKQEKLRNLRVSVQNEGSHLPTISSSSSQIEPNGNHDQVESESAVISKCDNYIAKLEAMFRRENRDVPDYLCGKISFEIMRDPVITPSGITYDRQDIEEHLRRVGHFDPITRQPLKAHQLISNLAMKEVVDAYLNENEWARYY